MDELKNIRNIVIEKGLDFPVQLTSENLFDIQHILSSEITISKDQIFIIIQIPLISKYSGSNYTLFKVTSSLYNFGDNLYGFIIPKTEFFAVDVHNERYSTLTFKDLNNCHQTYHTNNVSSIIRKQISPVMSILTSSDCVISLLFKNVFPSNCRHRFIRNNAEIFVKVLQPNSWLVVMPQKTRVRYMCEGKTTQEYFIQINGLLTIHSDCKFVTDTVFLSGHKWFYEGKIEEHSNLNYSQPGDVINRMARIIMSKNTDESIDTNNMSVIVDFGENDELLHISYSGREIEIKEDLNLLKARVEARIVFWIDVLRSDLAFFFGVILGVISGLLVIFAIMTVKLLKFWETRKTPKSSYENEVVSQSVTVQTNIKFKEGTILLSAFIDPLLSDVVFLLAGIFGTISGLLSVFTIAAIMLCYFCDTRKISIY